MSPEEQSPVSPAMQRWKLTLAYDGAPWRGWQSQVTGDSIQDQLEGALAAVVGTETRVHGSGRTDAGVHALAQIAHCDVSASIVMQEENWVRALNTKLPRSIRVLRAEAVSATFHARFDAIGKVYRYRISRAAVLSPFDHGRAWHVYGDLNLDALREALAAFVGKQDFNRFSALRGAVDKARRAADPQATVRTIHRADVLEQGDELLIEFEGDGFLYKMVRLLTGAAIHHARGRMSLAELKSYLTEPDGPTNHHCAPADGLYLVRVNYA